MERRGGSGRLSIDYGHFRSGFRMSATMLKYLRNFSWLKQFCLMMHSRIASPRLNCSIGRLLIPSIGNSEMGQVLHSHFILCCFILFFSSKELLHPEWLFVLSFMYLPLFFLLFLPTVPLPYPYRTLSPCRPLVPVQGQRGETRRDRD
ncbi:hypothetical protein PMAYCL1PPCAC_02832 [Pristionchus mayeri]|uniref:Uncharacterized protein n=1 Tax=Pristionchus mayeri TaxID=1317129 RepID=A0AAN4Z799_9BILA|nr:hypothetical protein PMAYCL1PPCAC_02832 [Pristionchus mayeri]